MPKKFSKNGLPLGRTPAKGFGHQPWSPEEDNYLKIALEEKITPAVISERLGRSLASIQTRKWLLKLPGRFARSKKGTVRHGFKGGPHVKTIQVMKPAVNQPTPHPINVLSNFGIGEIENNVPVPARGGKNEEVKAKLKEILTNIQPGQSFTMPKNLVYLTTGLVKSDFPEYKTKMSATTPDKKFYRLHRIM